MKNPHALLAAAGFTTCAVMLCGCAAGPDYQGPPEVDTGSGWIAPQSSDADVGAISNRDSENLDAWWSVLGDPELTRLVEQGIADNLDLRQALLRIEEARAALAFANAGRMPAVDLQASANSRRLSENGVLPVDTPAGIQRDDTIYDASANALWEPDLFGRIARGVEAADARTGAAIEDANAVRISVVAEIARAYLGLAGAQRERRAREAGIKALEDSLAMAEERVAAGDLAPADVDRFAARLAAARAGLPAIDARVQGSAIALGTLLGGLPEMELTLAGAHLPEIALPALPVGERADLLRRRPDVRVAERHLAAANAEIGRAMAEHFPKLVISASGGFQSLAPDDLWKSASQVYSVMPLVSWRVFDGGRIDAEIYAAEAREARAALAYEQAVLGALGEAERALSDYRHALDAIAAEREATERVLRARDTMSARFEAGDVAVVDVLDLDRELQEALERTARAETGGANSLVMAFKALGGGWESTL
jgi:NodT family efflux transporter outer membrane factor (OMF) lipoprotein